MHICICTCTYGTRVFSVPMIHAVFCSLIKFRRVEWFERKISILKMELGSKVGPNTTV